MSRHKNNDKARRVVAGQEVPFVVPGLKVTYEGIRTRKYRLKLLDGKLFRELTEDLNLYASGTIEWHYRLTGNSESNQFGCQLSWLDVENVQFCGMKTVLIYVESELNAESVIQTIAIAMLDQAERTESVTLP